MKFVIALAFIGIIGALAFAGVAMLRDSRDAHTKGKKMAHALAVRVALSVALFLLILISYKLGWIQPTGIPKG